MKVWFTVEDTSFDYANDGPTVKLFSTYEEAKKHFDSLVKWAEKECDENVWEGELNVDNGYEEYVCYDLGYYARDHIRIELNSQEV